MKHFISSFLIISAVTTSAFANPFALKPYVGIDMNATRFDDADIELGGLGLRAGTDIVDWFGVEGRLGTGIIDDNTGGVDVDLNYYIAGFAKLQTPDYNGFRVHGLAGIARAELEASAGGFSAQGSDTDFAYGGGVSYGINPDMRLNLEYLSLNDDADTLNLGLTYHF